MIRCIVRGLGVALLGAMMALPARASQNNLYNPTTGTLSGLSMVQGFNNAIDSVNTCNSGGSAPANQLSGSPSAGNCWYNTSTGAVALFDGVNWLTVGYIDATNHIFTPVLGGNTATSVASATTTNLCGASGAAPVGAYLTISGTTAIASFGSNCAVGQIKILTFSGALSLTYNATSMILPGGVNIAAAPGDFAVTVYLGSGNWRVGVYQAASGVPPGAASLLTADQTLTGGANVASHNIGIVTSGTTTVDCGKSPLQYMTNGGASTLAAPANDGSCMVLITNNTTAGTIAFSGFTVGANTGEFLDTTNGHSFSVSIWRINGISSYIVKALQ
jgi:hypothetical protein